MRVQSAVKKLGKYLSGYLVLIKAYSEIDFFVFPPQLMFPHYEIFLILKIEIGANSKGNCW